MNLEALGGKSRSNFLRLEKANQKKKAIRKEKEHQLQSPPSVDDLDELCDFRLASEATIHRPTYQHVIDQVLQKVSELEQTLYEDQQQEFRLRMALERQTECVEDLRFSLDTEKKRNGRLVQLLRGIDAESTTEREDSDWGAREQQHSTSNIFDCISPLLMQQRYDELSASHRQCRRLLVKKEKSFKALHCQMEQLQAKYDHLFDAYRSDQKRFEILCKRYFQMQLKKKQEIYNLKDALGYASECIFYAQLAIDNNGNHNNADVDLSSVQSFHRNLDCFMCALRNCCCLKKLQEEKENQHLISISNDANKK